MEPRRSLFDGRFRRNQALTSADLRDLLEARLSGGEKPFQPPELVLPTCVHEIGYLDAVTLFFTRKSIVSLTPEEVPETAAQIANVLLRISEVCRPRSFDHDSPTEVHFVSRGLTGKARAEIPLLFTEAQVPNVEEAIAEFLGTALKRNADDRKVNQSSLDMILGTARKPDSGGPASQL